MAWPYGVKPSDVLAAIVERRRATFSESDDEVRFFLGRLTDQDIDESYRECVQKMRPGSHPSSRSMAMMRTGVEDEVHRW